MRVAVFPGSFDPITLGHFDIVERAYPLFDKIIIAIGQNSQKKYMFSLEERMNFIRKSFEKFPNIENDYFVVVNKWLRFNKLTFNFKKMFTFAIL